MPMIDVYVAADLFPAGADRQLAEELTAALLKAEGVEKPGPTHLNNTGAYIHRLPPTAVNTAASGSARTVRVQVLTPPGVLKRAAQRQLVADVTQIVARISGDAPQAGRTWVLLTEAAEGLRAGGIRGAGGEKEVALAPAGQFARAQRASARKDGLAKARYFLHKEPISSQRPNGEEKPAGAREQ